MERQLRDLVDQVNAARRTVGRPTIRTSDTELAWRGLPKLSFDFLSRKAKAQRRNEEGEWVEDRGVDIPDLPPVKARARVGQEEVDEIDLPEPKGSVGPARVKEAKTAAGQEVEDLFYKGYDFDLADPYFLDEFELMQQFDKVLPPTTENSELAKRYGDLIDKLFDPGVPKHEKPTLRDLMLLGRGNDFFVKEWFGKDLLAGPGAPPIKLVKYPNEYERQKALREGQPHNLPPIERQPFPSPAEVEAALAVARGHDFHEGIPRGDLQLAATADAAGYSGKPTILPKDEYDAVPAEHLYRGVKSTSSSSQYAYEMMDQLMHGEYYIGFGSKANGTYVGDRIEAESFANPKGLHPRWDDRYYEHLDEDDGDGGPARPVLSHDDELDYDLESALIATKIHPDARIADWGDIPADVLGSDLIYNSDLPEDVFLWLMRNGYDGVDLRHFGELYGLAIINRLALIIRQRDQEGR